MFLRILVLIFLLSGCAQTHPPQILNNLPNEQALIVTPQTQHSLRGTLSAWENNNGSWTKIYTSPVVLGRHGLAGVDAKKEGDGHTPSGIYSIKRAFGYDQTIVTKLDYHQAGEEDFWVDDVYSAQYNQWVHGKPDAQSFEYMKRKDKLYRLGAVIEYNTNPIVSGKGSAIFLHIWRSYYSPTAGCVAASERDIRKILAWLDKNKNPVIVLTP